VHANQGHDLSGNQSDRSTASADIKNPRASLKGVFPMLQAHGRIRWLTDAL
jgi:hypothetical protein